MRTKKVLTNVITAWCGQFIVILFNLVARYIFVTVLNMKYLGVNGLFSNIVTLLSFAELGIGTAIIYCLYKPLANGDIVQISAYMRFYKKVYTVVGVAVAVLGISITPFIRFFMEKGIEIDYLRIIYILFVLNSASTYFFSYKQSLVIADQKKYITDIYHNAFKLLQIILSTIFLYVTRDYVIYLIIQILITFFDNLVLSWKADRIYPFLKTEKKDLSKEEKGAIWKNTSALFIHKVGTVMVNSTDSIILSKFVGIVAVGIYSNYYLISSAVQGFITMVFSSASAGVGNFGAIEDKDKQKELFNIMLYIEFAICGLASVCLLCLWNPFITLWLGNQYLLDDYVVAILALQFYILGKRQVVLMFRDALGLFWYDRYKAVAEAVLNLIISIILVQKIGIAGVFLGTIISNLMTCFWIEPYILFKYGFHANKVKYFLYYLYYFALTLLSVIICKLTCDRLGDGVVALIIRLLICVSITTVIFGLGTFKLKEFSQFIQLLKTGLWRKQMQ